MAELNFGLLTPPGSQSIGNAFVSGMDQAAAARAQENQNALSQYTLSKARREDALSNQLLGDLRNATTPEDIYRAYQRAGKPDVALKMQSERLTQDKLRGDILAQPGDRAYKTAQTDKLKGEARSKAIGEVAGFPDAESANAAIDYRLANNIIDNATADQMRQGLTPENFSKWKLETLIRMLNPSEQLTQSALKHVDTDRGGYIGRQFFDAQGNPSGIEQRLDKTVSPNITATLKQAREQAQRNFNNPPLSIQQTPTGLVGVNSRTGIANPVIYGEQRTPSISTTRQTQPVTSETPLIGAAGTQVMGSQTNLKPIPANINLAILANNASIKNIDETIKSIKANPEATGLKSYLPSEILNRAYPEGIEARAGVADVGSIILHDRSGAAVTASESPRLVPFIPLPTDSKDTVIRKLTRLRNIVEQDQTGLTETYGKDQGYLPNPTVGKTDAIKPNAPSPSAPPIQSFRRP
jgi:hypothetical protein